MRLGDIPTRTTLAIDDDILVAAKAIAQQQRKTLGQVVSELARQSLRSPHEGTIRNGVPLLPVQAPSIIVTLDDVNGLRDA